MDRILRVDMTELTVKDDGTPRASGLWRWVVAAIGAVIGVGMGMVTLTSMVAAQNGVAHERLGLVEIGGFVRAGGPAAKRLL